MEISLDKESSLNYLTASQIWDFDHKTGIVVNKTDRNGNSRARAAAGHDSGLGYLRVKYLGRHYRLHRVCWLLFYKEWPAGIVDHINGDKKDNRIENLRLTTKSGNAKNQKLRASNSSGVMGVHWNKSKAAWEARIAANGKVKHLGTFRSKRDAIAARMNAEREFGYHQNHGRKLRGGTQ